MIHSVMAWIRRHWVGSLIAASAAIGTAFFVLVYFAPQQLFITTRLDEPAPMPASSARAPASTPPSPAGPVTLLSGTFRSLEHRTTGRALLLRLPDGAAILRLENFSTSNGPDVHVYLSAAPAGGPTEDLGRNPVELGSLRANQGNINYAVPAGTDLATVRSAVIWCRRFNVGFGVASLDQA